MELLITLGREGRGGTGEPRGKNMLLPLCFFLCDSYKVTLSYWLAGSLPGSSLFLSFAFVKEGKKNCREKVKKDVNRQSIKKKGNQRRRDSISK